MNIAKTTALAAALALASTAMTAVPAAAQAAATLDVGTTVMGNDGNPVGTIASNDGATVVVDTGAHQVPLGADSFGTSEAGPTLNITKTQLDDMMTAQLAAQAEAQAAAEAAAAEQAALAAAALEEALVVGAPVITADAQPLGMVDEIDGEKVVIKGDVIELVTLTKDLLTLDAEGQIMALANFADIQAAVSAQSGG